MAKIYLQKDLKTVTGYDATKTQTLEHDENGNLKWVDKQ